VGAALRLPHGAQRPLANALKRDNIEEEFREGQSYGFVPPWLLGGKRAVSRLRL
jgi:hypothetical protein